MNFAMMKALSGYVFEKIFALDRRFDLDDQRQKNENQELFIRYFATVASVALIAATSATSVFAADAMDMKKKKPVYTPEEAVRIVQPPKPKVDSIGIQLGPEMYANSEYHNNHGKPAGDVKDCATKLSYSHAFENNLVLGGSIAYTSWYDNLESKTNRPADTLIKTAFEASVGSQLNCASAYHLSTDKLILLNEIIRAI